MNDIRNARFTSKFIYNEKVGNLCLPFCRFLGL